jgi:hypothetical protein
MAKSKTVGVVKVTWLEATGEYRCQIKGCPAADYFTNDLDDAIGTATDMDRRVREERHGLPRVQG